MHSYHKTDEVIVKFSKLPPKVKDFLISPEITAKNIEIEKKFSLSKKQFNDLLQIFREIVFKELSMDDFSQKLYERLGLEKEKIIKLSEKIANSEFLPIADYLDNFKLEDYLNKWEQSLKEGKKREQIIDKQVKKEKLHPLSLEATIEDKEIEDIKKKMEIEKPSGLDKLVDEIIKKSNLSFEDEILKKRFENIVFARLKDVRDDIETKEVLIKAEKIGGLELDDASADRVVRIAKDEFEKMDEKVKKELNLPKFELPKITQPYPAIPIAIETGKSNEIIPEPKVSSDKIQPNSLEKEISSILKENKLVGPDKSIKESAPVIKPEVETKKIESMPQPEKRKIVYESFKLAPLKSSESKAVVEDITRPPKVMGPIEELKYLSLKVFRRLAADPKEAILKIKQKIDVMEKESLIKKIQAIKAWRQSEVYKLYLEIGKESIEKNRETSQIVQERENSGKITLSEGEIEAIVELNKSLRF